MNKQTIKALARELSEATTAMGELKLYVASLENILASQGASPLPLGVTLEPVHTDDVKALKSLKSVPKPKAKRELSPKQLKAMRQNIAKGREAQAAQRDQTQRDPAPYANAWTPERRAHQGEIMRKRHRQWKREGRNAQGQPAGTEWAGRERHYGTGAA